MFRNPIILSISILIGLTSLNVLANDEISSKQAKSIHDENCSRCHVSMSGDNKRFYTRPDRKVDSFKKLKGQVNMCKSNLGLQWFDEEVDAVVKYLDNNFYKFK